MEFRIWVIWGAYHEIPKAILYLLKWDYKFQGLGIGWRGGAGRIYVFGRRALASGFRVEDSVSRL